jgi:Protein of unknown function (DUF2889)
MLWPDGPGGSMHLEAAARDLITRADASTVQPATSTLSATIDSNRTVIALETPTEPTSASALIGLRGGGGFRQRLQELLADDFAAGTLRYFLLDDLAATTLIGGFAWRLWPTPAPTGAPMPPRDMTDICSGFRAGGRPVTLIQLGLDTGHHLAKAAQLDDLGDPLAWHDIGPVTLDFATMRRRRRVDVYRANDRVVIEAMFRDSIWTPTGVEMVVHEYQLDARADADTMELTEVQATPRVLPYGECPAAAESVHQLVGQPLRQLRQSVLTTLTGTGSCTHLNDMLRALAEVPVLAGYLD